MPLLALSPELLLHVASHLSQVDLLNASLVCKHLCAVIEPELYCEYQNPQLYSRSFIPFIKKLISRPELAKYVRRIDLHPWNTLEHIQFEPGGDDERHAREIRELREQDLSEETYQLLARAAVAAGVISTVDPYEPTSRLIDVAESLRTVEDDVYFYQWYEYLFDDKIAFDDVPYDKKFCQLLRAGVEDPQAVLLLALLPNVQSIFLRGGPHDVNSLAWRAQHQFASLRELIVCGTDVDLTWPMAFFNPILATAPKLKVFQACVGSSWWRAIDEPEPLESDAIPLALQPGSLPHLHALDLNRCCLKVDDLRNLILACPGLKSFYYYGGTAQQGPYNPSPAKIIELLEPLKDTLEGLSLEVEPDPFEDTVLKDTDFRLGSLRHMTALRLLDTSAELWKGVEAEDMEWGGYETYPEGPLPDDFRLCYRLPPSLHTLIFHLSEEATEPAFEQMADLVQMRPDVLPNLQHLYIGTDDKHYIQQFDQMLAARNSRVIAGPHPLVASVGGGKLATVFDTVLPSRFLPDVKWFGHKYSTRWRKPNQISLALEKFSKAFEERSSAPGVDISDVLDDEPELKAILQQKDVRIEPIVYYDSDDDVPEKNVYRMYA